jgi:hypothetical protein
LLTHKSSDDSTDMCHGPIAGVCPAAHPAAGAGHRRPCRGDRRVPGPRLHPAVPAVWGAGVQIATAVVSATLFCFDTDGSNDEPWKQPTAAVTGGFHGLGLSYQLAWEASMDGICIRSRQTVCTCCRRVALASTCLGRRNGQRTSAALGRSKPPGATSRTACQQVAAPRGLSGGRAPRWVLTLHPRNLQQQLLCLMRPCGALPLLPAAPVPLHQPQMTSCRPSLMAGQMSATLPDRVVLMKQDSARVAHVDVRVALSKSLPQSSDAGTCDFAGTACQC